LLKIPEVAVYGLSQVAKQYVLTLLIFRLHGNKAQGWTQCSLLGGHEFGLLCYKRKQLTLCKLLTKRA